MEPVECFNCLTPNHPLMTIKIVYDDKTYVRFCFLCFKNHHESIYGDYIEGQNCFCYPPDDRMFRGFFLGILSQYPPFDKEIKMQKKFGFCKACGQIVYRIPGHHHGDGQVDSDENPVWLLADEQMVRDSGKDPDNIQNVICGCND
jgi:hypothetical protein